MPQPFRRSLRASVVLAILACAAVAVASTDKPARPPFESLGHHIHQMRNWVINAVAVIENDIASVDPTRPGPPNAQSSFARRRCGRQIAGLERARVGIEKALVELRREYSTLGMDEGKQLCDRILRDMDPVKRGISAFTEARDGGTAVGVLRGLGRALHFVEEDYAELKKCCTPPAPRKGRHKPGSRPKK